MVDDESQPLKKPKKKFWNWCAIYISPLLITEDYQWLELMESQISMFMVQSGPIRRSLVAFSTATVAEEEEAAIIIFFPSQNFLQTPKIRFSSNNPKRKIEKRRKLWSEFIYQKKKPSEITKP